MKTAIKCLALVASVSALAVPVAFAAPGGNSAGGSLGAQRSSTAMSNTNSSISADRDQGQDRAADRRSASGTQHSKEVAAPKKGESPKR